MNGPTTSSALRKAARIALVFAMLGNEPAMAQAAVAAPPAPSASVAASGIDDTADVLRRAEHMARQALPSPSAPATPEATSSPARGPAAPLPPQATARLYVFVSFSMPPASLQRLAAQAARLKVPLVLRGMAAESLSATARRAATIVEAVPGASFEIDPGPFRRFGITRVPAYLIAMPAAGCVTACAPQDAADVIVGDVTLDYALERLARGTGPAAALANAHLAVLKEKR